MRQIKTNEKHVPLSSLRNGESAIIGKYAPTTDVLVRLQEMGFVPGEKIEKIKSAPMGDPTEFSIMGYNICLRNHEATLIPVLLIQHQ